MSIPTISKHLPLKANERTIFAWETQSIIDQGRHYVKITKASAANQDVLNLIFKVVRYEFDGDEVIINTSEIPVFSNHVSLAPNERSIATRQTERVDTNLIKITDGSEGNQDVLRRVFKIVRYEFNGEKAVFDKGIE